jgi:DNA-binding NarL/FixJ family response regulator
MNLPFPWNSYLALQSRLLKSHNVDDTFWGCEAALTRILSSDLVCDAPFSNDDIDRWARNESRRARHRTKLRLLYLEEEHVLSEERALYARQELRAVRELVTNEEWTLLCSVSEGRGYDEIAARTGRSSGALRVGVSRLRHRLRAALAA